MPIARRALTRPLDEAVLRSICGILGATDGGLSNKEIDQLLRGARVTDPTPRSEGPGTYIAVNKRDRLFAALVSRQRLDGHANGVLGFVKAAMAPARYTGEPDRFERRREALNDPLAFNALRIEENGSLVRVKQASTLTEARLRAQRLRRILLDRGAHPRLLAACVDEIRDENYFHAVLEGAKGLAEQIRSETGLRTDGHTLVDGAFQKGSSPLPLLALNKLETDTERSRQRGLTDGLTAIVSAARNPAAHEPKMLGNLSEIDAVDLLTQMSYLHRQLDRCTVTARLGGQGPGAPR